MMNYFLGIPLDRNMRERLRGLTAQLAVPPAWVRWERAEKYHLTLWFFGPLPEERLGAAQELLHTLDGSADIPITVRGLGAFPDWRRARVLWAGVADPAPLLALNRRLADAAAGWGFAGEKRAYHPHITLGRFGRNGRPLTEMAAAAERIFGSFTAESVALYRSAHGEYDIMEQTVLQPRETT